MDVIILNGASSSGKSSIAKELQSILPRNYLHIGIDTFISMMPEKSNSLDCGDGKSDGFYFQQEVLEGKVVQRIQSGSYGRKVNQAYHSTVKHLADLGLGVIVDDVMDGSSEQKLWNLALGSTSTLFVGVHCCLDVLVERERLRSDRVQGSAAEQALRVHQGVVYDLELSTSNDTVKECAQQIATHIQSVQEGQSTRGEFGLSLGICVYGGKLKFGGGALLPLNAALGYKEKGMNETVDVYPEKYEEILKATHEIGFPQLSELPIGPFLSALVASKQSGVFLELGTGTGLCTSWLLHGMSSDSRLITVDNSAENIEIARCYLGADPRIEIVEADGESVIDRVSLQSVDLIFADTWPGKYHYLDEALACLKVGGFYVIDDMKVRSDWSQEHNSKVCNLIEHLSGRSDLIVAKLCWSTGIVMCVKIA